MSHLADGFIGTTTHHNLCIQPPPMYGTPKYPSMYGGPLYYPPPHYQQPYPIVLSPPLSGPSLTPMMGPSIQSSSGTPFTSSYTLSTNESVMPSYAPYGSLPQNNLYFPFPGPPHPISPPQGQTHDGVNFVQPSPIQQFQNFEQMNTENSAHQMNNAKNKGENRNNNNLGPGENNPHPNQPIGGNQNQGN
jgi:hypothetical protein